MGMARSGMVIARLLRCEGVNDYLCNEITRYAHRQSTPAEQERLNEIRRELRTLPLDDEAKRVIGKFINIHKQLAFDSGLRLGLTAMAINNDHEFPPEELDFNHDLHGPPKPQDHTYRIQAKRDSTWHDVGEIRGESPNCRGEAKDFARSIAMRDFIRTRIIQSGHVVQRYDYRGRKLGGDGE